MESIKSAVKGSTLYFYHLSHPEDEFIQKMMNMSTDKDDVSHMCYKSIVKNGRIDIIRDIMADMSGTDLQRLARIAVKEKNKEIVELLYKNNLDADFYVLNRDDDRFLVYTYKKGGLEFIKFMGETGFCLDEPLLFSYAFQEKDTDTLNYLLEITTKQLDKLFRTVLANDFDVSFLIEFFSDKIDIIKHKYDILASCASVDDVKSFMELTGITIDSNEPLRFACRRQDRELVEFYLQYGLQVDNETLEFVLFNRYRHSRPIIDLLLKYNVDFSMLNNDYKMDYELIANLENHGLNKDIMLPDIFRLEKLK